MNVFRVKLLVVIGSLAFFAVSFAQLNVSHAEGGEDEVLEAIAKYKKWTRINSEPIEARSPHSRDSLPAELSGFG